MGGLSTFQQTNKKIVRGTGGGGGGSERAHPTCKFSKI